MFLGLLTRTSRSRIERSLFVALVQVSGFEPLTTRVSDEHSNHLNYTCIYWLFIVLSPHFLVHDAKMLVH